MDVTIASLLGLDLPKIVRAKARRLNSQSEKSCGEYIRRLEASLEEHKVYDRLLELAGEKEPQSVADFVAEEAEDVLEELDQLMTKLMLDAEKKCRKLYAAHYEFSPQVKCWLDRCHAYENLIKLRRSGWNLTSCVRQR